MFIMESYEWYKKQYRLTDAPADMNRALYLMWKLEKCHDLLNISRPFDYTKTQVKVLLLLEIEK